MTFLRYEVIIKIHFVQKNFFYFFHRVYGGEILKFKTLKRVFSVLLSISVICFLFIYFYIQVNKKIKETELLRHAENIINHNVNIFNSDSFPNKFDEKDVFSTEKIEDDKNIIGKIQIKKIGVDAPIIDGTSPEVLKVAVGHFQSTSYWKGNVGLASHNRGSYAHYFEKINKLEKGDEIIYQTKIGKRAYIVQDIIQIREDDWKPLENTEENAITLITCIKNNPEYRLCVKAIENI